VIAELTPVEAAWLVISVVGLIFAVINLVSAKGDLTASHLVRNYRRPTRLVLAAGAVHRNWVRVGVFAWWTLLGIMFGFFDLSAANVPRIGGLLGLVVTAAGMAWTGFHETRERHEVAALLAEDIAEDAAPKP
jgi:hypothetical protein